MSKGQASRDAPNPSGVARTISATGAIDETNPFFRSIGSNGRACVNCHLPEDGWALRPQSVQAAFQSSQGTAPLFRTNDGSVCTNADTSTLEARRKAFALLLSKGLIRVELTIPASAEFELASAEGVYCNDTSGGALSLFRRPLPSTNLKFIPAVMWDGRESPVEDHVGDDLATQSNDATVGHAQATASIAADVRAAIVGFETNLFTAQASGQAVGALAVQGGLGGPDFLATVPFNFGINDDPHDQRVFTLYDAWASAPGNTPARAAILRGQAIFNNRTFRIQNVAGQDSADFMGQCTTCHLTPNVGSYSVAEFFDIGVADGARRTPDLPLYTLRNKATGATIQVSDPGRAMITGKWADIGEFKPANLRAVATRAPYFHNGSAATLDAVVDFYNSRFGIGLSAQEHADLVVFLQAL